MKKLKVPERDVLATTKQILEAHGFTVYRINNTGIYSAARKVHIFHGTKGLPDLVAVHDACNVVVFVECKGSGGKLTPEQKEFLDAVDDTTSYSAVVYGGSVEFEKFQQWVKRVKE